MSWPVWEHEDEADGGWTIDVQRNGALGGHYWIHLDTASDRAAVFLDEATALAMADAIRSDVERARQLRAEER